VTKLTIVGHDKKSSCPFGADRSPCVFDEANDHRVGRPRTTKSNGRASGNSLAAQTAFGRSVEDELDRDRGGDDPAEPADQRRGRRRAAGGGESMQHVRAIDQHSIGFGEGIPWASRHR
jgi:hypothetical protein